MFLLARRNRQLPGDPEKEARLNKAYRSIVNRFRSETFSTFAARQNLDNQCWPVKVYLRLGFQCHCIASSTYFQSFITCVIILASALVGIQTYPGQEFIPGREDNTAISSVWNIMDQVVLYIFTLEVVIKVVAEGLNPWRYFCRRELREDNLKSSFKGDDVGDVWKSVRRSRKSLKVDDLSKPSQTSEPHPKSKKNWKLSGFRSLSFDFWNIFDFAVVVVCYLPLGANMVAVIRLFRLLRVLKLVKALPELQVLVLGLFSSLTAIFYVSLLLMIVFYFYAVLSVTTLRENDPVNWGSLEVAFLTLFRIATLEDWIDVVFTAMLGCDVFGYGFREDWCTSPKPIGWVAAPIFVSFVLVATFVILNLFIGVINENMGIAKEQLVEMKKQEVLNKSQANPADDSSTLRRDIILLERQVKRLAKRSARLHQAMGMLGYDLRVLAANLQKRSKGRNKYAEEGAVNLG